MSKRPSLAECIGVPERWQALACLYAMLELQPLPWAWRWAEMASRAIRNRRSRYVLSGLARGAIDEGERAGGADRAICRLIAWELACELVERRKREAGR